VRLAYLVSHPIQYQAPLLRRIAREPGIDLTVFFGSDFSLRGYADKGFGVAVQWDVPLVEGYRHEFLPALRDNATSGPFAPISRGIFSRLRGRKNEAPFDVLWVHGYASVNALHGIFAAGALGIPVLLRAESTLIDRPRSGPKLLGKRILFRCLRGLIAGVLPIGTLNEAYWKYYLGEEFPAWSLPYAVDNDYFRQRSLAAADGRSALQAELGLDPARPVILFASKLQERKRCIDLLEAYLRLAPAAGAGALLEPNPYLVIVGDGEERAALEDRARRSGVRSIRFCGFRNQSELPRFFDLASVFVLPSRHEPWGLIVNEVMNAARPVIVSSDVGCQPDLVTDGVEGFVFPAGDVAALTAALRGIFEDGAAGRMGESALKRMQSWDFERDVRGMRAALAEVTRLIPVSGGPERSAYEPPAPVLASSACDFYTSSGR
jgi:glycosyltransferase involved in cell wall biosynthesis